MINTESQRYRKTDHLDGQLTGQETHTEITARPLGRRLADSTTGPCLLLPGASVRTATLADKHISKGPFDLKDEEEKVCKIQLRPVSGSVSLTNTLFDICSHRLK